MGGESDGRWLDDEGVAALVRAAPVARMAVATRRGPLVSSQLHVGSGGRLWMISSRRSARVRVIGRDPMVSVALRSGRRTAVLAGEAQVLAPWGFGEAAQLSLAAPAALHALLGYATHNSTRMAAYLADLLRLPPRREALPFDRVVVAVTPLRGFVWSGAAVTGEFGEWPGSADDPSLDGGVAGRPRGGRRPRLPRGIPPWVASIATGRQACTVGWETPDGPLALPAVWDPLGWCAEIATAVAALVTPSSRSAAACIALDRSVALRPSSYAGLVLRGQGRLEGSRDDGSLRLALATERVSWWSGFTTGTVEA